MSTLQQYLEIKKLTVTQFAEQAKLPIPTVWRYVNGKFKPSADNALTIEQATGGAVTLRELLFPDQREQDKG
jgi:transcriptional regulator with XRE-family HTH domain